MTELTTSQRRALTEPMTVLAPDQYEGVVEVNSSSGKEYLVDIVEQRCSCAHYYHQNGDRHGRCAHIYRALWATSAREIPAELVDAVGDEADPYLGRWCDGEVRIEGEDEIIEAGDDGEVLEQDSEVIEA